ncbi:MAG: 2-amino-4-ketopentanoate thiolase [Anaerolineales bacterium]|nr:2-amino-4-ketopentanoate thiolase [Anaerolineales bacterium]
MNQVLPGTWVEIEQVVLTPEQRAPSLPEDTKQVPYILRVSGFLIEPAELGQPAHIRTIIGRELSGVLKTVNPSYSHSFGMVVPELLTIGTEAEQ